jgi:type II secretory pathway component PulJ
MLATRKRDEPGFGDRMVVWLELLAASAIFAIVALVLYMVFTYHPA